MNKQINLSENLGKLRTIAEWFDSQQQVDVEDGLKKVQEAAVLIKESKSRLREIENEFEEIQAEISDANKESSIEVNTLQSIAIAATTIDEDLGSSNTIIND